MQLLKDHKLFSMFTNCKVWKRLVAFLVHIVSSVGIEVDTTKTEAVNKFPRPLRPMDFQRFCVYPGIIGDLLRVSPLFLLQ